jgi:hypothetical protein
MAKIRPIRSPWTEQRQRQRRRKLPPFLPSNNKNTFSSYFVIAPSFPLLPFFPPENFVNGVCFQLFSPSPRPLLSNFGQVFYPRQQNVCPILLLCPIASIFNILDLSTPSLSLCVSLYLSVSLSLSLSVSYAVSLSVSLYVSFSVALCFSICVSISMYLHVSLSV